MIANKRHLKIDDDPQDGALQAPIRPKEMAAQIEDVIEASAGNKAAKAGV